MKFCPDEEKLVLEIFKTLGSGNTIKDVPVRFRTKNGDIKYDFVYMYACTYTHACGREAQ